MTDSDLAGAVHAEPEHAALTGHPAATVQDLIEQALALSGADRCIVVAAERTEANLRWAGNSLTTNGQMASRTITVISFIGSEQAPSVGVVSRAVSTGDELASLVADSERAARAASPAEDAAPMLAADDAVSAHDVAWDDPAAATSIEVFSTFAPALGEAFRAAQERGELLYGFAEHIVTAHFVASSTGLRRRFDQPTGRLELNAKSADLTRSAWGGAQTKDFSDLDVRTLALELSTRLGWATRRLDLPAGRYETILPPTAVADLMIYAYWTATARAAEEGRSVFSGPEGTTTVGSTLTELDLTLRSDPLEPGLECPTFVIATSSDGEVSSVFDNGAPISATDWISHGRMNSLMRTRNWAERTGEQAVPAVDNLVLDGGGTASLAEMIAGTERGLLITCLWYIRQVDPETLLLTGLTRDGVYLIEHGEVVGAVNNFRFNESPIGLLSRITEVGRTEHTLPREWNDYFTRTAMPPVRVADFNMSTVSKAS